MAGRRILLISYLFPPAGGVAVQRALSLARYLPRLGHEVHVLSARNPSVPTFDPSLMQLLPAEVRLHRAFSPEVPYAWKQRVWRLLSAAGRGAAASGGQAGGSAESRLQRLVRRMLNPDPEVVWVRFAISAARRIVRRHAIEAVLVTAPPFSSFMIATAIKREYPGVKLIADFRDEWLEFYLSTFDFHKSASILAKSKKLEREIVDHADAVVSVTRGIIARLRRRYADQPPDKFHCIPNGFDPEALAHFRARPHGTGRIVVVFAGTLYKSSSARYHLDGLDRLPAEIRSAFDSRFVGRVAPEERRFLEGRTSLVTQLGFVPQAEAFRQMEEADFLMLTMTDADSLTGKIFEYLATGKPVLAYSPKGGEVDRLIAETGAGWCADPSDPQAVDDMLRRAYAAARGEIPMPAPDLSAIAHYSRPKQAEQFHQILEVCFRAGAGG